ATRRPAPRRGDRALRAPGRGGRNAGCGPAPPPGRGGPHPQAPPRRRDPRRGDAPPPPPAPRREVPPPRVPGPGPPAPARPRPAGTVPKLDGIDRVGAHAVVEAAGEGWLDPAQTRALLSAYGVPLVAERTAGSTDEAVAAAGEIGYPVVVKTATPGAHKTESGGDAPHPPAAAPERRGGEGGRGPPVLPARH